MRQHQHCMEVTLHSPSQGCLWLGMNYLSFFEKIFLEKHWSQNHRSTWSAMKVSRHAVRICLLYFPSVPYSLHPYPYQRIYFLPTRCLSLSSRVEIWIPWQPRRRQRLRVHQDVAVVVSVGMDKAFFFLPGAVQCVFVTLSSMLFHRSTSNAEVLCNVRTDLCLMCKQGPITQHPSLYLETLKRPLWMPDNKSLCHDPPRTWLVRRRGMVIPFEDTDCSSPTLASRTFVVCLKCYLRLLSWFFFFLYLFQRLKYWDEQQQQQHPSSLVPLHLSFPSLPPGGLLGEQLSHHLLPLLILYLLLLLLPPPSFCFAFATDGDNLCHFPRSTFNPLQSLSRESVCMYIFYFFLHLAEFMFVRVFYIYTVS